MIDNVAKAMETRRRELIAQPLNRIWPELARAAIEAMREPTKEMEQAGYESQLPDAWPDDTGDTPSELICASLAWTGMINAALTA